VHITVKYSKWSISRPVAGLPGVNGFGSSCSCLPEITAVGFLLLDVMVGLGCMAFGVRSRKSQTRLVPAQRMQAGFVSSHLIRRILVQLVPTEVSR
jgi:hypothetical protein